MEDEHRLALPPLARERPRRIVISQSHANRGHVTPDDARVPAARAAASSGIAAKTPLRDVMRAARAAHERQDLFHFEYHVLAGQAHDDDRLMAFGALAAERLAELSPVQPVEP